MDHQFTAWLRGVGDPTRPAYIAVPVPVMRALRWGRFLKVRAEVNGTPLNATIMNVGYGPSLFVPAAARKTLGVALDEQVRVRLRLRAAS